MNRDAALNIVRGANPKFDLVIIGGGATGAGVALDAASRGLKVLLLERGDFGSGTSSRSTKIIHGGVRYLAQGRVGLVREALRERATLLRNAAHLVAPLSFIVPVENIFERAKYFVGLKFYDFLSGKQRPQSCDWLSRDTLRRQLPELDDTKFCGAMRYFDGQFDDTRLLLAILETATVLGAVAINYAEVTEVHKDSKGRLNAVTFRDGETNAVHEIKTEAVVNATGAGSDAILKLDEPGHRRTILPSQGAHIVLPKEFLPGTSALLMPRTPDGRIMFAIPWLGHVMVGTTDTEVDVVAKDPIPLASEIDMILDVAAQYLTRAPQRSDVLASFAGIRPLALAPSGSETSKVSREHRIDVLKSGMISVSGGKWTTYRLMAEQCVDTLISSNNLSVGRSMTAEMPLHATPQSDHRAKRFVEYGNHAQALEEMILNEPALDDLLSDALPYRKVHCLWAVRHEMARTIEDVLARRTRALFLNEAAALEALPQVLEILTRELGLTELQQQKQIQEFHKIKNKQPS
ncbi:MAG: glycerol-3-phosphate dehydrogenase [Gammaproteobacteria bacterium]|jgi:glycerol-3-phosphate dehydrogenase